MKIHVFLALFAAVTVARGLLAQETSTFDQLKFEFQVRRAEIQKKSLTEPMSALNAKYQGFLLKLKDAATKKGDLDEALAINKAIEEFGKGSPPDGTAASSDLKRAQEIYRTESATIRAGHAKELKPLVEAYQRRLGEMVTELTKAQRLEAALAARQESEAMTALLAELGGSAVTPVGVGSPAPIAPIGTPASPSTSPLPTLAGLKQGKLNGKGYFYGGKQVTVDSVGSNRFVSVFPLNSFDWIGLRPNGSVATDTIGEIKQFRGRIAKLGTSDLRYQFAGIDSTGRLQVVSTNQNPAVPVPEIDKKVIQFCISSVRGKESYLALLEDGTVKYWGSAYEGADAKLPPASALSGIRAIAATQVLSYAAREDGTVVSWRLGIGEAKVPEHIRDVVEIAAGIEFAVARTSKGEVLAWGSNTAGQCNVPDNLGPCSAIRASSYVGAARKADGKWVAWGSNMEGLVDQIAELPPVHDIAFFGNNTKGYSTFLLWIE
jgi:hypothetical protein